MSTLPRRVLVTGAASGIGAAVAEDLLNASVEVVAIDRSSDGLDQLGELGAEPIRIDVTDVAARGQLLEQISCDGIVNAAGVMRMASPEGATEDAWDELFDVNVKSAFFICQEIAPSLPNGGSIVNVSSLAARVQQTPETAVYAATKAALLAVTRSFAHALAPRGIRVNSILPGIIDTPMQDRLLEDLASARDAQAGDLQARRREAIPLGRCGSPAECAAVITWLLGEGSSYITGQSISVDGGLSMF